MLYLRNQKIKAVFLKQTFQEAFKAGFIKDDKIWISMLDERNKATHIYDESFAKKDLSKYSHLLPSYEEALF